MANLRILASEEMVGHGHGVKADTLNRQMMIEHSEDGVHNLATPLPLAQGGTATALGCRIKTGSYTGNGAVSFNIAGIGFQPLYVKIWTQEGADGAGAISFETTDTIMDDHGDKGSMYESGNTYTFETNTIIGMGADFFTVDDGGGDNHPNSNTIVYNYLAIG